MDQKMSRSEKLRTVTAEEFGRRVAQTFWESKSSTAVFFIQQAFADYEDDIGIFWTEFESMLTRISQPSSSTSDTQLSQEADNGE